VAASGQRSFVGTEGYIRRKGRARRAPTFYSLGKLLYETCTGKDRLDFPEVDSQLSTRPDRERLLPLNDVLVKACANDPNKRYGSAAEMHRDLTALKHGERPRKSRAKILLATAVTLVLLVAAIGFWLKPPQLSGDLSPANDDPDRAGRSPCRFRRSCAKKARRHSQTWNRANTTCAL